MLDNALKPRLGLKFPPAQLPVSTAPPPKPKNSPIGNPISADEPGEPPVSWSNFREILATLPPPPFDVAKSPTPEQWAAYGLTLTDRQKKARRYGWVSRTCAVFSHSFGDAVAKHRAYKFARSKQSEIFAALGNALM